MKGNELDNLFKEKLGNHKLNPPASSWDQVAGNLSEKKSKGIVGSSYGEGDQVSLVSRAKASYGELKGFREGQAIINFGDTVIKAQIFYSNPKGIKSLRVNKFLSMPHHDPDNRRSSKGVEAVLERFREKGWSAENSNPLFNAGKLFRTLAKV